MTRPTEPTDLGALTALLDAGTPGPWETTCMGSEGYHVHEQEASVGIRRKRTALCTYEAWEDDRANATLIAALRNAAPGLIAEVTELRRKVEAVERVVNEPEPSVEADGPDDLESVYVTGYNGALILVRAALETA